MAGSLLGGPLTLKVPHGFPPVYFYRLTAKPRPGDEMVAGGGTPIHMRRVLLESGNEGTMPGEPEGFCLQCLRIKYLSQLSGMPLIETDVAIEPNTAVHPEHLDAEIARALERQVADINRLGKSLLKSGALEPSEVPMTLRIDVKIEDRTNRLQLLPVPPLTFVLRP
jgi:hypothetical protein